MVYCVSSKADKDCLKELCVDSNLVWHQRVLLQWNWDL